MLRRPVEFPDVILISGVRGSLLRAFCWCLFVILLSAVTVAQPPSAPPPILTLYPVSVPNSGQVSFRVLPGNLTQPGSAIALAKDTYMTSDNKFTLVIDPDKIESVPPSRFTFTAYAKRQDNVNWYAYSVVAEPAGEFPDLVKPVSFRLKDGSGDGDAQGGSVGTVHLPLHADSYGGDLKPMRKDDDPPLVIRMSDSEGPAIVLENTLENLSIHVTKISVTRKCGPCWQDSKPDPTDISIQPRTTSDPLKLNIRPKPFPAMLSTALKLREGFQDILSVTVDYNVAQGGASKRKQVNVPVRFTPVLWQMGLAVIAGALIGGIIKYYLDEKTTKLSASFVARTLIMAGVAEFLAAIAATYDSKLVILGLDVDPRQVIPAFLLAFAATGGPQVIKWAMGVLRPGTGDQEASATRSAGGGKQL